MLVALLLGTFTATEVRVLTVTGILDTQGTATIRRVVSDSDEVTLTVFDDWGKNDSWTETLVQSADGELIRHSFKWVKPSGKNSAWSTAVVDGQAQWRTELYEGEVRSGINTTRLSAAAVGDPTLNWWRTASPKPEESVERHRFVPMFGYEKETVTFSGDQSLKFGAREILTHKIKRTSEKLTVIAWLDSVGMPVRREFYRPGSGSPHRIDVWNSEP